MLYFNYQVVYYARGSGREPVRDYINFLAKDEKKEIDAAVKFLLKQEGKLLPPYAKHIHKKIWELRIKCMNRQHRILYFIAPRRRIVLLSAFPKKTQRTPRSEIKKAYNYYLDYLSSI